MKTYQQIIKETTASVIAGSKTPERALADTIYKWRDKGITPVLIDKGGHEWSLEGYTRTVIDTTSNRAFQAVRNTAAADNGIDTFVMSSHAACRPACAPIQGKTVTTRLTGFTAPESGEWFEPLDNHGYKEPSGTFGINCHHMMWPYIPGVNTNDQEQFDPQESIERYKWQQKQRGLERKVREFKRNEDLANQLDDDVGRMKYGLDKRKYQSALRKLVNDHDFLARDYGREKVYGPASERATYKVKNESAKVLKEYDTIASNLGKYAPKSLSEYSKMKYTNRREANVYTTIANSNKSNLKTVKQRESAIETYLNFKKHDVNISDHALEQYVYHSRCKNGQLNYNFNTIINNHSNPANYRDKKDGRLIHFYNRLALIEEVDGRIVTITKLDKPKGRWESID
ncbi:phage minor capsid protein [Lapidilactobacillus bayanensis]|uniref:phage minor capsid protein n=1 Tax=Lapidilactobacillus bayanensis TaxID=2485998 RepID=UPI000F79C4D0|nr:phage minor capsid protein [Lapidilactobacillus bayanensis]